MLAETLNVFSYLLNQCEQKEDEIAKLRSTITRLNLENQSLRKKQTSPEPNNWN